LPESPGLALEEQLRKQGQEKDRMADFYEAELAKKYGISREELDEIEIEGMKKHWPMPKI
jgi:hypothetical protein